MRAKCTPKEATPPHVLSEGYTDHRVSHPPAVPRASVLGRGESTGKEPGLRARPLAASLGRHPCGGGGAPMSPGAELQGHLGTEGQPRCFTCLLICRDPRDTNDASDSERVCKLPKTTQRAGRTQVPAGGPCLPQPGPHRGLWRVAVTGRLLSHGLGSGGGGWGLSDQ